MITKKSVTSDTLTVVNPHSLGAEGWRQLVTSPNNFSDLQQPSLVTLDVSPIKQQRVKRKRTPGMSAFSEPTLGFLRLGTGH